MKALIITGKLVQDHEFIYPYYRLQEAGYEVVVAAPKGEPFLTSSGIKIVPTVSTGMLNFTGPGGVPMKDYELLLIPGGAKCMEYLRQDQRLLYIIHSYQGVIAAICHGSQMLISAKLVKGKRVSGYYSIKDDINNAGGTYVDEPFVTDGNLVTTAHYKHLGPWMKEVLRVCDLRN